MASSCMKKKKKKKENKNTKPNYKAFCIGKEERKKLERNDRRER